MRKNKFDEPGSEKDEISRDDLHELVTSLQEGIASGAVKIPPGSQTEISLKRVRLGADGKVDPKSVDSSVRAACYATAAARAQREMNRIPLRDIQAEYFDILDQFFGKPFSEMKKHGVTAAQVARQLASSKKLVEAFKSELEPFRSGIKDFWEYYAPVVEMHVRDLHCLKSVYGGDVFPSYAKNVACSVGLYVDTLVLPDPLFRLLEFGSFMEPQYACFMVSKHALSALRFRDLALADVNPPIIVVAPDPMLLEENYTKLLQLASDEDMVEHCQRMFNRSFSSVDELNNFLRQFSTTEELTSSVADAKRFLFDAEWSEPLSAQFERHRAEMSSNMPAATGSSTGETAYMAFFGRMMQTNDLLLRSARYGANPVVEAATSWQYLLWKYEYDAERNGVHDSQVRDLVISKAIETEGSAEFGMLADVPPEVLIELRRLGAMQELRRTLHDGISTIDLASASSLSSVTEHVVGNIDRAFEKHAKELDNLTSAKRKFFGLDVGRWVVGGGVSIAAAMSHNPALSLLGAISPSLIGAPSVPDLKKRWKELRSQATELKRSPVAVLFSHLGSKFGFSES